MKKLLLLTLLISLVTACHGLHDQVRGSGNLLKEKRETASFNSITTDGAFDIEVVCQKAQSVEIEGDDNLLSLVSTQVSNNVLHVRSLRGYSASHPITLKINVPELAGVSSSGAGTIVVTGLKNPTFEIKANGAPNIRASGEAVSLSIDANGAGKIDTHKLRAAKVRVDLKGVPNVELYASDLLEVTISGPSRVTYSGNAEVRQTINGPGHVEKKESEGS